MDITNYIGRAIAYYRDQKGWSTVQLAEASDLSQGSISLYENGKRNPSEDAIGKLANALDISTKTILERAEHFARQEKPIMNESQANYEYNANYERLRQIDRIYRFNDFVFKLNPDILLSINTRVHDIADLVEYGGRGSMPAGRQSTSFRRDRRSLIAHLTEKVFAEFIHDHKEEIAYRIDNELQNLNMDAYQFIEELRKN